MEIYSMQLCLNLQPEKVKCILQIMILMLFPFQ